MIEKAIEEHEILFIGSHVYAHHLQHDVKEPIKNLPKPINRWGKMSFPLVTYGGISSGISFEDNSGHIKYQI